MPRELQALERIAHPNIVALREVIDDDTSQQLVVVMQYLDGTQLSQLRRLPSPEELRKWARQLISAIYTCHTLAKVCHRDIKPENLKVTGANNDLVLFDFGASECFTDEDDIVTTTAGSYSYFAPEQLKSSQNSDGTKIIHARKTDIWAAGVSLYQIASGAHPFRTKEGIFTMFNSIQEDQADYSVFKDSLFVNFLKKMLEKDPQ